MSDAQGKGGEPPSQDRTMLYAALVGIAVLVCVLLLLILIQWEELKAADRFTLWMHKIGSDILMALVVALLPVVLFVAEILKKRLTEHTERWQAAVMQLQDNQRRFQDTQRDFETRAQRVDAVLSHTEAWALIRERALKSISPEVGSEIIEHTNELAKAWAEHLCIPLLGADAENPLVKDRKSLECLCWEAAFRAYMKEEAKDLRRGPVLATNYPTYLGFLSSISDTFVKQCQGKGLTPCFVALANTTPAEWVMVCERRNGKYICAVDPNLAQWRATCRALATKPGVVFRRIFLTADDQEPILREQYRVPLHDAEFMDQLKKNVAWDQQSDKGMERGLSSRQWDKVWPQLATPLLPFAGQFEIPVGSRGFRLTVVSQAAPYHTKVSNRRYEIVLTPLRQIVVNDLHGAPLTKTARLVKIDSLVLEGIEDKPSVRTPSDLLIIGVLKEGGNAESDYIAEEMLPLFAVECRARDIIEDVSVLVLYKGADADDVLKPWIALLEQHAIAV